MKKGGSGGGKTITGIRFESRVTLANIFEKIPGYTISGNSIYFNRQKVAELYGKYKLYKNLLEPNKIDYSNIISKRLIPDDAVLILKDKILCIVEIKFQMGAGSVDEKLQTCDFKNKQYKKLLSPLGISIKYVYVLCDWFKKKEYKDTLDYIKSVGCYYFFEELPLDFLSLPKPT